MNSADRRSRRRPILLGLLLAASLLSLGTGMSSLAIWTDSEPGSAEFTAGTVDLAINPATLFSVTGIVPGQTGSASLTVENSGTVSLRYALTSSSTNTDAKNLRDQLQMTVSPGACPGGTALFGPDDLALVAFGDAGQGADTGDRTLAAGAREQLCFAWSLPSSTGDAFQGATTSTTLTFAAEQTASNP